MSLFRLPALVPILLLIAVSLGGCKMKPTGNASDEPARPPSYANVEGEHSEKMRGVLTQIHAEATEEPMRYFHLNDERAEAARKQLEDATPEQKPGRRYTYAYELLYAGDTEAAIQELNTLLRNNRISMQQINEQTKPIFELLALAYLRMGEQRNCIEGHTSESCILPIRGSGVHANKEGSENAAGLYERIIRRFPGDAQSRWLLNVAYMTLGRYPDDVNDRRLVINGIEAEPDSPIRLFPEVGAQVGVADDQISGGTSVEDFNNDGHLDILVTSYGLDDPMKLYLSDGEGGFTDHTSAAGLDGIVSGLNTVHADYNNDGYEDVFVLRGAWLGEAGRHPNSLLRNNGDGTFTDVTYEAGLDAYHPSQSAAWADFNLDGHLDLFVGNESNAEIDFLSGNSRSDSTISHPSALYLNEGDGTFTNVSETVGLDVDAYVKGVTWGDVNNDGLPDLYLSVLGGPNRLYVNRGSASVQPSIDTWQFQERAQDAGVQRPFFSFPTWFWDYNNDGYDDLFVSAFDVRFFRNVGGAVASELIGGSTRAELPRVYRNQGDGTFADVTSQLNLDTVLFAMGANYGDLDNDGYQDFYAGTGAPDFRALVPNRMFHNRGGEDFQEVTYAGGFGHVQKGHGIAFADLDNDGDQDVYAVMGGAVEGDPFQNALFENPGHGNRHLTLDLRGNAANRSAIGARIQVTAVKPDGATRQIHRTVRTGGSFGASPLRQTIGLGDAVRIERVRITWPNETRTTETFRSLEVDGAYRIVEGEDPEPLDMPPTPFRKDQTPSHSAHHTTGATASAASQ